MRAEENTRVGHGGSADSFFPSTYLSVFRPASPGRSLFFISYPQEAASEEPPRRDAEENYVGGKKNARRVCRREKGKLKRTRREGEMTERGRPEARARTSPMAESSCPTLAHLSSRAAANTLHRIYLTLRAETQIAFISSSLDIRFFVQPRIHILIKNSPNRRRKRIMSGQTRESTSVALSVCNFGSSQGSRLHPET